MSEEQNDSQEESRPTSHAKDGFWSGLGLPLKLAVLALAAVVAVGLVLAFAGGEDPDTGAAGTLAKPKAKTVTETETIGYSTRTKEDPKRAEHEREIRRAGVVGKVKVTYNVYSDGREIEIKRRVLKDPVDQVVVVGTKGRSLTKRSWEGLRVADFTQASAKQKAAVADRYLNEKKLKKPNLPWQDPNWLVGEMDRWVGENPGSEEKRLDWEFGYRVAEWKREQTGIKIEKIELGASIEDVKAVLGEPSASRRTTTDGTMMDYFYYGPVGDRDELVFSSGSLVAKSR